MKARRHAHHSRFRCGMRISLAWWVSLIFRPNYPNGGRRLAAV